MSHLELIVDTKVNDLEHTVDTKVNDLRIQLTRKLIIWKIPLTNVNDLGKAVDGKLVMMDKKINNLQS